MKTTEEKAKAYDKALERARELSKTTTGANYEYIFPELKESEDERIRKAISQCVEDMRGQFEKLYSVHHKDAIAWLEKQGKEEINDDDKAILENWESIVKENREKWQLSDWFVEATYLLIQKVKHANTGMQGEQKPADKVEPKFKVGDWCIDNEDGVIYQIVKVLDNTYTYKTNEGKEYSCTHYSLENDAKLWSIQDAKEGDMLVYNNGTVEIILLFKKWMDGVGHGAYSYAHTFDNEILFDDWSDCGYATHPATKEQRDILFKKMHEAGYMWDEENKELKKVKLKTTQSEDETSIAINSPKAYKIGFADGEAHAKEEMITTWSEDDEKKIKRVMHFLSIEGRVGNNELKSIFDWLKSLKQRI